MFVYFTIIVMHVVGINSLRPLGGHCNRIRNVHFNYTSSCFMNGFLKVVRSPAILWRDIYPVSVKCSSVGAFTVGFSFMYDAKSNGYPVLLDK